MSAITVLVAAREPATRASCIGALARDRHLRLVGEAATVLDTVTATVRLRPRVVILASSLARERLPVVLETLRARAGTARILVVGARASEPRILDSLAHGAHGHLELRRVGERLRRAVVALDAGQAWVSRRLVPALIARALDGPPIGRGPRFIGRRSNGRRPRRA